jgi:ABC-type hemin transport system ATPase subunit
MNTAQEKLFTVHLVLAALLAAPNPEGRVLIIDELGDSLGINHRREVLRAIAATARQKGVLVLGTCQDSVLADAATFCDEVLYFECPNKTDALNRPTRMLGFDANGERVDLGAEQILAGRQLV